MGGHHTAEALKAARREAGMVVDTVCFDKGWGFRHALIGAIAPLILLKDAALAAHQQVTAERDEEKARADRNDAKLAEITQPWVDDKGGVWLAPTAWAYAKACGALHQHRDRANAAEASLATVTSELARLQAEGEAKDRRIAALTEALAPFARFADMATPDTAETWAGVHHSFRIGTRFKHEHFRAARAATAREGA